jgi:purine-nucleoside phosphorylase
MRELLEIGRAKGTPLNYGSGGVGTASHLSTEYMKLMTGASLTHVPYKGLAPAIIDLTAGRLDFIISTVATALPYSHIPHFPAATVQGHPGRLLYGTLAGTPTLALQGRFHLYEGYTPLAVAFPVRVLQTLGVDTLLLSNAAGGLNPSFRPGDLMLITDHINLTGENPLVGPNFDRWGLRFPDMSRVYDPALAAAARKAAATAGIPMTHGVYAGLKGPSLETPAEIRFLKTIGADAVGMSTIQETITAVHGGTRVLGVSTITNLNDPDHPAPATVEAIVAVAEMAAPHLGRIFSGIAAELSGA